MTLLMRDQENFEKGIEQGKIYGAVSVYREMGMTDYDISVKLQKKFRLSEKEAEEYL
ncbi:MAG: hypothetical protein HFG79_09420 [Lachnospiraceae bacterium]|jgi:hypothetical protein|nr:hypothetical protein [Lachnospiraceae bacterium]